MARFLVEFPHFFIKHYTPVTPVPPGQLQPTIMRFTHHIQAIKFSLVHRVAAHLQ